MYLSPLPPTLSPSHHLAQPLFEKEKEKYFFSCRFSAVPRGSQKQLKPISPARLWICGNLRLIWQLTRHVVVLVNTMVVIHNLRNEVKIRQFWGVNVHIPDILIVEAKVRTLNTLMHPEQSHISSLSAHSTNRCTYKAFPSHCLHSYSTNTSGLIYPFSPLSPLCIRPKSNNECIIFSKLCSLLRFTNTKPRNLSDWNLFIHQHWQLLAFSLIV